jgi:hypothetical protein
MAHHLSHRLRAAGILTTMLLGAGALAGCESYSLTLPSFMSFSSSPSAPEQVRAATPRVSYNYRGDQESMAAKQKASAFCSQYQGRALMLDSIDELDGTTTAEFECVVSSAAASHPGGMSYSYRDDRELLNATRDAQAQCTNSAIPMTSTVTDDGHGNHTVTFQCGRS